MSYLKSGISKGQIFKGVGIFVFLLLLLKAWGSFYSVTVNPGEELVVVDNPYFFGKEGIRDETLKEGRHYLWKTSSVIPVGVTPQTASVIFDDLSSQDNILLDFESSIQFQVTNTAVLRKKFGPNWFANNVKTPYMSIVRKQVKQNSMSNIMSDAKTSDTIDENITNATLALVKEIGLPVIIHGISLGRAKPNEDVLKQMNSTAAEQQRKKTMTAAKEAEDSRREAEIARASADNAYRNNMNLDTSQFVQLEQSKAGVDIARMYSNACAKSSHCIVTTGALPVVLPSK